MQRQITLVDVAPRDGIQNESAKPTTATKCELIGRIAAAGIRDLEVASFVSPKWVPQMVDAADILPIVNRLANLKPIVLAVNDLGYERAVAAGAKRAAWWSRSAMPSILATRTRQPRPPWKATHRSCGAPPAMASKPGV